LDEKPEHPVLKPPASERPVVREPRHAGGSLEVPPLLYRRTELDLEGAQDEVGRCLLSHAPPLHPDATPLCVSRGSAQACASPTRPCASGNDAGHRAARAPEWCSVERGRTCASRIPDRASSFASAHHNPLLPRRQPPPGLEIGRAH